jgi:hypothetical protein
MGFGLMPVNPYLIKQMPGRKSDVKGHPMDRVFASQRHVAWQYDPRSGDTVITDIFPQIYPLAGAEDPLSISPYMGK